MYHTGDSGCFLYPCCCDDRYDGLSLLVMLNSNGFFDRNVLWQVQLCRLCPACNNQMRSYKIREQLPCVISARPRSYILPRTRACVLLYAMGLSVQMQPPRNRVKMFCISFSIRIITREMCNATGVMIGLYELGPECGRVGMI